MFKRITSSILALITAACATAFVADAKAAQTEIEAYKLELLNALGIIKNVSDYDGGAVTRLEGAEAILAMLNVEIPSANVKSQFGDIKDYTRESAIAGSAKSYGIMVGSDGNFAPDDVLTFNEAVKIIMSALGYDTYAGFYGGFPTGYIKAANNAGLFKNVTTGGSEGITQDRFYEMIYNATKIPLLQADYISGGEPHYKLNGDETFLEKYHNVVYTEGRLTGNSKTVLGKEKEALGKGDIKIGAELYREGSSNAGKYLGCNVRAYVRESDDEDVILWAYPDKDCEIVTVAAGDMQTYKQGDEKLCTVDENGSRDKRYRISAVADFIYNGKYTAHIQELQLNPDNGYLELIDIDGDNTYDCVKIYDYITYRINGIDRNNKTISDRYMQKQLSFKDDANIITVERNGVISDFYELEIGDVLLVAADCITVNNGYRCIDDSAHIFDIVVLEETVSGTAENVELDDDGGRLVLDGEEYKVSAELGKLCSIGKISQIRPNRSYVFVMGLGGKIIDIASADEKLYGFFCRDFNLEEEELYEIKFFDLSDKAIYRKRIAEKVTLNGKRVSHREVYDAFRTNSSGSTGAEAVPQLFIYRENVSGEIYYIDTWIYDKDNEDSVNSLQLSVKGSSFAIKSGKYHMSHKFVMSPDAKVLKVRVEKHNGVEEIVGEESSFTVSDREIADYWESYNAEAYNCNSAGVTDMVVIYKTVDYDQSTEIAIDGGMMFKSIKKVAIDGEVCQQIDGYTPGGPVSIILEPEVLVKDWNGSGFTVSDISKLKKGDIIKYELNNSRCMKIERIFSYTKSEGFYNEYHYYRSYAGVEQSHFAYGKAFAWQDDVMRVKFDKTFSLDDQNSYAVLETEGKDVLVFDTESNTFEIVSPGGILYADNTNDYDRAYDIVFHTHDMRLDTIYAYR